jgi:hypothetical protein
MVNRFPFPSFAGVPIVVPRKTDELVGVVEKLNELARNDSDEETDLDEELKEINCTQDEFINKRILPDLLSNQSIHLLDQTQSHEYRQAVGNIPQRTTSILTSPKDNYLNKRSSQVSLFMS